MPSREPGDAEDPAAELLDRWQAHVESAETSSTTGATTGDTTGSDEPGEHGSRRSAEHQPPSPRRHLPRGRSTDAVSAAREVREAFGLPTDETDPGTPESPEGSGVDDVLSAAPAPRSAHRTRAMPPEEGVSADVTFAPRLGTRRLLGLLLLTCLAATAGTGYLAYEEPRTLSVGLACTLLAVTLVLYAVRAGSSPTHLAIRGGQLEVVRGSKREIFDLTSRYTRVQVVGRPDRRGWKVLLGRFGRDPLVIDGSMVEPKAFMIALERLRPPPDQ